jgi:hypothetical protein
VHRFRAEQIEAAIQAGLLDFYTANSQLVAEAVAQFQQRHAESTTAVREQITAVTRDLQQTTAVDRYLHAFETGVLDHDDTTIKARLKQLKVQIKLLRGHKAELRHP